MNNEIIINQIKNADMILVGLGEEFDCLNRLKKNQVYRRGKQFLLDEKQEWLIPLWNDYCADKPGLSNREAALMKLYGLLEEKNYFVVSTAISQSIAKVPWKNNQYVMPCGCTANKQCEKKCTGTVERYHKEEENEIGRFFDCIYQEMDVPMENIPKMICKECGERMIPNTVYFSFYNENGYLKQWDTYKKWLQGTLNHKLLVLELGVDLTYPTVIRWPFEKIAYFNNKSFFVRINEQLYQLTEELAGKGIGISENAIDWLINL